MTEFKERELEKSETPDLKVGPELESPPAAAALQPVPVPPSDGEDMRIDATRDIQQRILDQQNLPRGPSDELKQDSGSLIDFAKPIVVLLVLLILPWIALGGVDWSRWNSYRFYDLGQKAMDMKDYSAAEKYFALSAQGKLSQDFGPNQQAYVTSRLADAYYMANEPAKAAAYYEQAGHEAGHEWYSQTWLGKAALCYAATGSFEKAVQLAQEQISTSAYNDPQSKAARLNDLAYIYWEQGNFAEAMKTAQKAIDTFPWKSKSLSDAHGIMGDVYWKQHDNINAMKEYQSAIDKVPEHFTWTIQTLHNRAMLSMLQGDQAGAVKDIQTAIAVIKSIDLSRDPFPRTTLRQLIALSNLMAGTPTSSH